MGKGEFSKRVPKRAKSGKSAVNSTPVSACEHSRISSRFGGGYADHP
jgi:hypothetical protein